LVGVAEAVADGVPVGADTDGDGATNVGGAVGSSWPQPASTVPTRANTAAAARR
jgi:hypothetical protein